MVRTLTNKELGENIGTRLKYKNIMFDEEFNEEDKMNVDYKRQLEREDIQSKRIDTAFYLVSLNEQLSRDGVLFTV